MNEVANIAQEKEWKELAGQGNKFTGVRNDGIYIPTVKLNNSDKVKKEHNIALGQLYLTRKEDGVEIVTDLGKLIKGVILKVSYSVKSNYDPAGKAPQFYSREFDSFFDEDIIVMDGKSKEVYFCGSYKDWKEENQIISSRGKKNDFVLTVHLYVLIDGNTENPNIVRVNVTGKSMTNWFGYMNGDKELDTKSLSSQGIYPHTHIHEMLSMKETTPKGETYYSLTFSFPKRVELEELRKIIRIQFELNKQIQALRGNKQKEIKVEHTMVDAPHDEISADEVPF